MVGFIRDSIINISNRNIKNEKLSFIFPKNQKDIFNFSDYKINEERRRQIFYANNKQFFAASSKIIDECYKPENNISISS